MIDQHGLKPLIWIGSRRRDLRAFPELVQGRMGYALYVAQRGGKHENAKPLKGLGDASVLEIVSDFRGDTFRAIYTLRLADCVFVLHAFQKKSKQGRKTPSQDIAMVMRRLREAEEIARRRQ